MAKFLVSCLFNLETTLRVEAFPVSYVPVRFPFHGVASRASGVGYYLFQGAAARHGFCGL